MIVQKRLSSIGGSRVTSLIPVHTYLEICRRRQSYRDRKLYAILETNAFSCSKAALEGNLGTLSS
jgi:hypothetical protein